MADITMCANNTCPKKDICYRKTAKPNELMQSVALFKYERDENGIFYCAHFWFDKK